MEKPKLVDKSKLVELDTRDLMWHDVASIDWDNLPVGPDQEYVIHGRCIAGNARNFSEFYAEENRSIAQAIERWLTRYADKHRWRG